MNLESVRQHCPYCGEVIELLVDASAGPQRYTEDCEVCCRPMVVCCDPPDHDALDAMDAFSEDSLGSGLTVTVLSEDEASGL